MDFDAFAAHVDSLAYATVGSSLQITSTGETLDVTFHPKGEGLEIEGSQLDYSLPRISVTQANVHRLAEGLIVEVAGNSYRLGGLYPDGTGLYWANLILKG